MTPGRERGKDLLGSDDLDELPISSFGKNRSELLFPGMVLMMTIF